MIGAFLFNPFLAVTRIPSNLAEFMAALELAPIWILIIIVLGYIVLGTFLEGIADGVPMSEIFMGVIPFWGAMLVCAALLIAFPDLALFLPETMIRN